MRQYAGIYLLQNQSTCFGCPSRTSSGVHKTVTAATGTGHSIWVTTFLRRGLRPKGVRGQRHDQSTCFGCPSQTSSGVHKTVTAATGTGHSISVTTFLRSGLRPRRRKVVTLIPVPVAAVTVLCTPDDGCDGHPKHVDWSWRWPLTRF